MESTGLSYEPRDGVIDFNLGEYPANAQIKLKNQDQHSVVLFKVKTTMPNLYYVRPNFDILEPGQEIDIAVFLVEEKQRDIVESSAMGEEVSVSKHRFMVQAAKLSDKAGIEASKMKVGDATKRDYTTMWNSEENGDVLVSGKSNIKFRVKYDIAQGGDALNGSITTAGTGVPYASPLPEYKSTRRSSPKPIPTSPEEVRSEIVSLRDGYEKLLKSFCRVQAEKELLEQEREVKKGKLRDVKAMSGPLEALTNDRPGFSLLFFVVSVLLAFVLGQYLSM